MIKDDLYTVQRASEEFHIPSWKLYEARDKGILIPEGHRTPYRFTKEALLVYQQTLTSVHLPSTEKESPMIQTTPIKPEALPLRIGNIYQDKERFFSYPPFQRQHVWGWRMKHLLIDSILRGWPINALTLMEDVNARGERVYQVSDGQQRLSTIFEFLENGFATMTERQAQGYMMLFAPVEPGKRFGELSRDAQNRILDYRLQFIAFPKEHEDVLEEIFLRFQNQEALVQGERLFIHNSRARQVALHLLEHPLWQQSKIPTRRREQYTTTLMLLALEIFPFPVHLKIQSSERTTLVQLVLGDHDSELTDTLQNTVWKRLSAIDRACRRTIKNHPDAIILYQATQFLDDQGFDLLASEAGCLDNWFWEAKRSLFRERLGMNIVETRMTLASVQREFWRIHRDRIGQVEGLVRK